MGLCNISLALVFLLVLVMVLSPHQAQNAPQDYLDAHNTARAQVGVGPMTWDNTIAAYAQNYANQRIGDCNLVHSGGPYGENLAMGSGGLMGFGGFTGKDAVTVWVAEKLNYDYNSNSCAEGKVCEHYTQVVWGNSIRLGCASAQCNNGWWFITCNYDPPGNSIGQRPYPLVTQLHLVCTVEL